MKKVLFSLAALVCSTALFAQTDAKTAQVATSQPAQTGKKAADVVKFESETINLGKIKQDVPATATFIVTNVSKEPLIIEQANPTCGCTIGDYTKQPIAPGKTGIITATYNAKNLNAFEKHMTVKFAGVDEVKSITIKGEVLNPEEYAKLNPGASDGSVKIVPAGSEVKTVTTATTVKTAGKRTTTKKTAATSVKIAPKS
ncbi:MAG: DUF1573 domain-containing protein [Ferruginibacter sp.]|nr:DUF1573 domain-containing protein [Ferruginibacter sp.]